MSSRSRCSKCYWEEQCCRRGYCEDYTPVERDFADDEYVDGLIENKRNEYREEWMEYAEEMLNEMYF